MLDLLSLSLSFDDDEKKMKVGKTINAPAVKIRVRKESLANSFIIILHQMLLRCIFGLDLELTMYADV